MIDYFSITPPILLSPSPVTGRKNASIDRDSIVARSYVRILHTRRGRASPPTVRRKLYRDGGDERVLNISREIRFIITVTSIGGKDSFATLFITTRRRLLSHGGDRYPTEQDLPAGAESTWRD